MTRRPPRRSPASSGSAAALWYPGAAGAETETSSQPDQGKRGARRSVKAATPSASSPAAMVSRYQRATSASPSPPAVSAATTCLVARWDSADRLGQDVGEAVHLGLEVVGGDDAVDQTGAQRGLRVDQLAAEQQVLRHRRADEVDQGLRRGRRVDDADLGRGHPEDAGRVGEAQVAAGRRSPRRRRCSGRGSSRPSASGSPAARPARPGCPAGRRPSGRPGRGRRAGRRCRRPRRSWARRRSRPARGRPGRRRGRRGRRAAPPTSRPSWRCACRAGRWSARATCPSRVTERGVARSAEVVRAEGVARRSGRRLW